MNVKYLYGPRLNDSGNSIVVRVIVGLKDMEVFVIVLASDYVEAFILIPVEIEDARDEFNLLVAKLHQVLLNKHIFYLLALRDSKVLLSVGQDHNQLLILVGEPNGEVIGDLVKEIDDILI